MTGYRQINYAIELTLSERVLIHTLKLQANIVKLEPSQVVDSFVYSMYPNGTETKPNVLKNQRSKFKKKLFELLEIDKKTMQENKYKNDQKTLLEIQDFGFIPN